MARNQNDHGLREDFSGQELNEEQLSLVLGAATWQLTRPRQSPLLRQFDFAEIRLDLAGIHPDLEEPKWPKPPPPPPPPTDIIFTSRW